MSLHFTSCKKSSRPNPATLLSINFLFKSDNDDNVMKISLTALYVQKQKQNVLGMTREICFLRKTSSCRTIRARCALYSLFKGYSGHVSMEAYLQIQQSFPFLKLHIKYPKHGIKQKFQLSNHFCRPVFNTKNMLFNKLIVNAAATTITFN